MHLIANRNKRGWRRHEVSGLMVNKSPLQSRHLLWILVTLVLVAVSFAGCGLLTDTTSPSAITGLGATDAYDGRVNLWWDRSTAEDFDHYNIYVGESAIADVSGMTPVQQIKDIDSNTYQVIGLEPLTKYYFAVTVVDQSGNENKQVIGASAISTKRVSLDVPTLVSTPDEAIMRKFTWKYGGIDWDWEAEIPKQLYQTLHDKPRPRTENCNYSVYVTQSLDDGFFQKLASALSAEGVKLGFTNEQMVELAVLFVQTIPYSFDIDTTGREEYPRYPIETLIDGTGDCEDHSILLAELLRSMNYDAILLFYSGESGERAHMAIGVADNGNTYGTYYDHNGKSYYYIETTFAGWRIGDIPEEFKVPAYTWDLVPVPFVGCERLEWPAFTGTMPLEITIYNDGTAPALGVTAYAYLDAGNNMNWAWAQVTVDIPPEETRTVTLELTFPNHPIHTRVIYRIIYGGYKVDEGFSDWFDTY